MTVLFTLFFSTFCAFQATSTPIATTIKLSPILNTTYPTPLVIVVKLQPYPSQGYLTLVNLVNNQEVVKKSLDLSQPLPPAPGSTTSSSPSSLTVTWNIVNAGVYILEARYQDANQSQSYSPSQSQMRVCSMAKASVELFLQATPSRQNSGQPIQFVLNVTVPRPSPGPFNGQVQFLDYAQNPPVLVATKIFSKNTSTQQSWVQMGYCNNVINLVVSNFSTGVHRIRGKFVANENYASALSQESDVEVVDVNSTCPFQRPNQGAHCTPEGLNCQYDLYCCPNGGPCSYQSYFSCTQGSWLVAMTEIICPTSSHVADPPIP